jgi:hypothetical protein
MPSKEEDDASLRIAAQRCAPTRALTVVCIASAMHGCGVVKYAHGHDDASIVCLICDEKGSFSSQKGFLVVEMRLLNMFMTPNYK